MHAEWRCPSNGNVLATPLKVQQTQWFHKQCLFITQNGISCVSCTMPNMQLLCIHSTSHVQSGGKKRQYSHLLTSVINKFGRICSYSSLFPRPLPDFISQSWRKIGLRLGDKIWEWPGNEAIATVLAMYLRPLDYHSFLRAMVLLWNFVCMTIQTKILQGA